MTTVTFDTLKFVEKLKSAGYSDEQAKAQTEAISEALTNQEIITKKDLQIELAPMKADIALLKWMIGFNLAFTLAVLWKILAH